MGWGEPAPKGWGVGLCLSQHTVWHKAWHRNLRQAKGYSLVVQLLPEATPRLPHSQRDFPCSWQGHRSLPQGYLHFGIVGSTDFIRTDGGHWHIAPELGATGREEGQRVHATQRRADHNRGAQVQGVHHSCQEAAGDQLPDRGRGCCILGMPQACRDFNVEETRQAGEWGKSFLPGSPPRTVSLCRMPDFISAAAGTVLSVAGMRPRPRQYGALERIGPKVQHSRTQVPIFHLLPV